MITSKQGQPSTYSPNTQNVNRRRLGLFMSAPAASPLAKAQASTTHTSPAWDDTVEIDHDGAESPVKLGKKPGGATYLSGSSGSHQRQTLERRDDAVETETEDEGCFLLGKQGDAQAAVQDSRIVDTEQVTLMACPDEILLKVIYHLPLGAKQLLLMGQINKRFAELSRSNRFWNDLYHRTPGWTLCKDVMSRVQPSPRPPMGHWTHDGWEWVEGDTERQDGQEDADGLSLLYPRGEEAKSAAERSETGDSGAHADFLQTPMKRMNRLSLKSPTTPTHRSRTALIPAHYPTLVRSRTTLSRLIRNPSHLHRPAFENLSRHSDSVYCLHAVGRWLITGSRDRSIRLWRLGAFGPTGQPRRTRLIKTIHDAHEGSVLALHFELDDGTGKGVLAAGSSDMGASVWDLDFSLEKVQGTETGEVNEVEGNEGLLTPAKGVTGGKTRAPTIKRRDTLKGHTAGVLDVLLTPRYIVTCSKDTSIRVYNRVDGKLRSVLQGHEQPVNCLARRVGPSKQSRSMDQAKDQGEEEYGDQVVSASADGNWIIWDLSTGAEVKRKEATSGLACVAWHGDYIVTGDNDRLVKVYDAITTELIRTFKGHKDLVRTISVDLGEGLVVSGSYDKSIMMWDLHTGELLRKIQSTHTSLVFDLQMTSTRLISASHDKSVQVVSLATGLPYLDIIA